MTNNLNSEQPGGEPPIGEAENAIELRAVEGKSQRRIVRERFFAHRGAIVGLIALILIMALAMSSIGFGFLGWTIGGWGQWTPQETSALALPGGRPNITVQWGDAGFGQGLPHLG